MDEASEEARIPGVGELTRKIRSLLEAGIGETWVEGEISNHRRQASGHHYFTLKDESAQLSCVLFARQAAGMGDLRPVDGMHVEVFGGISVYEPRGQYQLVVRRVRMRGTGTLHARFEALKARLGAEGLFNPERKRPLPKFPARIGVVTSPTGAALRDFVNVLHRRHPGIEVIINPVRVQGRGAAAEIAAAIDGFSAAPGNGLPVVDVVVVTRGGGSLEDLWEFNEEVVARSVAACKVPVVSAVGHEIDFTICDFAADVRAPTPSAAAEILSAEAAEVSARLERDVGRMRRACDANFERASGRLRAALASGLLREPVRRMETMRQSFDRAAMDLQRLAESGLERRRALVIMAAGKIDPRHLLSETQRMRHRIMVCETRLATGVRQCHAARTARLEKLASALRALDPQATLARGFTITCDPKGNPLTSAKLAETASVLLTRFVDGDIRSRVEKN
jgi:exodeoxyribonuclease VII large subunit